MGQHSRDLLAGTKIDQWNRAHRAVLDRVNDALNDFEGAIGNFESSRQLAQLHAAGQRLAEQMRSLQSAPLSGVPQYDGPRLDAMAVWERAGQAAAECEPEADGDVRTLEAAALLNQGRKIQSVATKYTTDLVARLTARAPR